MSSAPGDAWDDVPVGHLCDGPLEKIRAGVVTRDAGDVIVKYSHIVLHVGEVVWRISEHGVRPEWLDTRGETVIQPGELVSIVTDERLALPAFVSGTIFLKGRMPSLGLMGASTTIDPGFDNYLRVTVANVGGAAVRLPRGLAIAKAELVRLPCPVERPYVSRENPKTILPRDDYLFAGRPLVRLERRQRRMVTMVTRVGLLMAAVGLVLVIGRLASSSVTDAQARTVWTNVMAGVAVAAALAFGRMASRAAGWIRELLGGR